MLMLVGIGMLVAVVLICTVPLYSALVGDAQLQHLLATSPVTDVNVEATVSLPLIESAKVHTLQASMMQPGQTYLKHFAPTSTSYLEATSYLQIRRINGRSPSAVEPTLPGNAQMQPLAWDYQAMAPHMRLLAGRLPHDVAPGQSYEIDVTPALGLHIGDRFRMVYTAGNIAVTVRIVGVWQPKDAHDAFWNGQSFETLIFAAPGGGPPPPPPVYPLLFTPNGFLDALGTPAVPAHQTPSVLIHGVFYTQPDRLTVDTMRAAASAVQSYHAALDSAVLNVPGVSGITVKTALDTLIGGLQQQLDVLAQPLYIVVVQVAGLALLFIFAMAGLLIENQAGEIATLKSRGASGTQLLGGYTLQGLLAALLAALAGPFIAVAVSIALIRLFVSGGISLNSAYLAHAVSPGLVTRPAVVGAALGTAALAFATWQAARLDILAFRRERGRATRIPFWKRYYLDLALVAVCLAGYVELSDFGGLTVRSQLGQTGSGADPLLLVTPGLLLLAGALVTLRVFPLLAAVGMRLIARGRGATGMLAFAQVARATAQFSRLTLLLTLAIGLGLFALTFQASLTRNAADRAAYMSGSDERLLIYGPEEGTQLTAPFQGQFARMPGVLGVTPIYRSDGSTPPSAGDLNVGVLGIDPASFASVAIWRSDYADRALASLMRDMAAHAQGTAAGDSAHPLWALVDDTFASVLRVKPGDRFELVPHEGQENALSFVVGAVIHHLPTMYDSLDGGYIAVNQADYIAALNNPALGDAAVNGPTEFWLHTTGDATASGERAQLLASPDFFIRSVISRRDLARQLENDPITAGMTGVLLLGTAVAVLLAILGSIAQSVVAVRQRLIQLAILRTLGMAKRQLARMLLAQQLIIYLIGLLGGILLGAILSTATLPFLQFSAALQDAATIGVPPYVLALNPAAVALLFAGLALAFALALALGTGAVARAGLSKALRLGED